jgi:hypothetical protein
MPEDIGHCLEYLKYITLAKGSKFTNEMRGKIWSQKIIVRTCGNFEKPHFKRVDPLVSRLTGDRMVNKKKV